MHVSIAQQVTSAAFLAHTGCAQTGMCHCWESSEQIPGAAEPGQHGWTACSHLWWQLLAARAPMLYACIPFKHHLTTC